MNDLRGVFYVGALHFLALPLPLSSSSFPTFFLLDPLGRGVITNGLTFFLILVLKPPLDCRGT